MNTIWKTNPLNLRRSRRNHSLPNGDSSSINLLCSAVGYIGGPLILRMYFLHGGSRKWLSSWLQTAGFPILLIPLAYLYLRDQRKFKSGSKFFANPLLLASGAVIGVLTRTQQFPLLLWFVFSPCLNVFASYLNPTCFYSYICLSYV